MKLRARGEREAWLTRLSILEGVLLLVFYGLLIVGYMLPLHSGTLELEWWSWMIAAAPLVLVAGAEGLKSRWSPPKIQGESLERLRYSRTTSRG